MLRVRWIFGSAADYPWRLSCLHNLTNESQTKWTRTEMWRMRKMKNGCQLLRCCKGSCSGDKYSTRTRTRVFLDVDNKRADAPRITGEMSHPGRGVFGPYLMWRALPFPIMQFDIFKSNYQNRCRIVFCQSTTQQIISDFFPSTLDSDTVL